MQDVTARFPTKDEKTSCPKSRHVEFKLQVSSKQGARVQGNWLMERWLFWMGVAANCLTHVSNMKKSTLDGFFAASIFTCPCPWCFARKDQITVLTVLQKHDSIGDSTVPAETKAGNKNWRPKKLLRSYRQHDNFLVNLKILVFFLNTHLQWFWPSETFNPIFSPIQKEFLLPFPPCRSWRCRVHEGGSELCGLLKFPMLCQSVLPKWVSQSQVVPIWFRCVGNGLNGLMFMSM